MLVMEPGLVLDDAQIPPSPEPIPGAEVRADGPGELAAGSTGPTAQPPVARPRGRRGREAQRRVNRRSEAARVRRWLEANPTGLPMRLISAALRFWGPDMPSVSEVAAELGVTRDSAWDYLKRVRRAMRAGGW